MKRETSDFLKKVVIALNGKLETIDRSSWKCFRKNCLIVLMNLMKIKKENTDEFFKKWDVLRNNVLDRSHDFKRNIEKQSPRAVL